MKQTGETFTSLNYYPIYNHMQFQPIGNYTENFLIHKFSNVNSSPTGTCSHWLLKGIVHTH